ncbi:geraniol dehydrogenase [Frondihabitans sp. PAMC 28766]|uniref:NAD(P)-dependent alcohol dehydrogenase n=1 Tax=Frondihabitans sp. PAMC 28766 TaxID=1795630 RepID=UPI00078D9D75|nr:NAD(P)-dependent alcohol dehydrogenase [Frondihabitans sp. PAMC 28766]AMM21842.1 geraniol dehydrogenase [Frondihabitans sp. PAMC 28766]
MEITAAVIREVGGDVALEKVDLETPRADEILVKITAVGLCHTDIATIAGALPFPMPGVLGHEGSGIVAEVGSDITKVVPGDRVAISFASCGTCPACVSGEPAYCHQFMALNYAGTRPDGSSTTSNSEGPVGSSFFGQSTFGTHAITKERNVVKVPDDFPLELAGPLGCGIQTGAGAIMRSLKAAKGSAVVVAGGGSVGLSGVLGAVVQGCSTIILVEPVAARRELALTLGATHVIDPAAGPVDEQIRAIVPDGAQYGFDTTRIPAVIAAVLNALGNQGVLGLVAIPADPTASMSLPLIPALLLGLTVKGIVEGDSVPDEFIPQLMSLYQEGRFPFDKLITKLPFDQINEGMKAQHDGTAIKVVLTLDEN